MVVDKVSYSDTAKHTRLNVFSGVGILYFIGVVGSCCGGMV